MVGKRSKWHLLWVVVIAFILFWFIPEAEGREPAVKTWMFTGKIAVFETPSVCLYSDVALAVIPRTQLPPGKGC